MGALSTSPSPARLELGDYSLPLTGAIQDHLPLTTLPPAPPTSKTPFIIHMLGPPGTGKSLYARMLLASLDSVGLDAIAFDGVMAQMPGYAQARRADAAAAFRSYEMPARWLGYHRLFDRLNTRCNILFDHSGAVPGHIDLLKDARERLGYNIVVCRLTAPLETALYRVRRRYGAGAGRHTPFNYLQERADMVDKLSPDYEAVADVFEVFDNTPDSRRRMETHTKRLVACMNQLSLIHQ